MISINQLFSQFDTALYLKIDIFKFFPITNSIIPPWVERSFSYFNLLSENKNSKDKYFASC